MAWLGEAPGAGLSGDPGEAEHTAFSKNQPIPLSRHCLGTDIRPSTDYRVARRRIDVEIAPNMFAGVRWGRLVLGVSLTAVLALSVHAVMLQWLHVPYPDASVFDSALPDWLNDAVMLCAAVWLYRCLRARATAQPVALRFFVLFGLLFCLNETLRGAWMNGYCVTRSWSERGGVGLISCVHGVVNFVLVAGFAAGIGRLRHKGWQCAAVIVATSLLAFLVSPSLTAMDAVIRDEVSRWVSLDLWCKLPYGMEVLIPAYLTFLEPVFASFVCFALVRRHLPGGLFSQAASFALLLLALKRQLLTSFLYAAFAPGPVLTALASMGQFSLEAAALGLLTALSWRYARADLPSRTSAWW
jgi:hypothetical protein